MSSTDPGPTWHVEAARTLDQLRAAAHLFDRPVEPEAAAEFLADPRHHLLLALTPQERLLGFVSGVVLVHPDKGREMFLYELGVEPSARGHGVATALVSALVELARSTGCRGMWVLTDDDNPAAVGAYRRAGATSDSSQRMLEWSWS